MIFQRLEDRFDGANRMNLRHFIQHGDTDEKEGSVEVEDDATLYFTSDTFLDGIPGIERKKLSRIPSCAVFHKVTGGKGVPHTFIGMTSSSFEDFEIRIDASMKALYDSGLPYLVLWYAHAPLCCLPVRAEITVSGILISFYRSCAKSTCERSLRSDES